MRLGRGFAVIVLAVLALSMTPAVASAQTTPDPDPHDRPERDPDAHAGPHDHPVAHATTPRRATPPPRTPPRRATRARPPIRASASIPAGSCRWHRPGLGGRIGPTRGRGRAAVAAVIGAWAPNPKWGAYSTQRLVVAERRLERHGMPERKALDAAFAPFPVGGLAVWSDTWGAPRYAGGYHPHHGQDLLCAEGTPLLAVQPGVVEFGSDPLGGTTIELTLRDGSFWYYAHLDHYAKGLTDGEHVSTGQVIGACGQSGDATVPHLHFSYFTASGDARNPMHALLGWLHRAEHRAGVRPSNGHGVPTPPMAELATPSVMHPRPETTTTGVVWASATYVVAPGGGFDATAYAAAALLLAPIALLAASRRARSWVIARIPA